MAVRWAAASFLDADKGYRRIIGYKDLWMLKAQPGRARHFPRLTERRLPRSMNRPRATATSNYGWDSIRHVDSPTDMMSYLP